MPEDWAGRAQSVGTGRWLLATHERMTDGSTWEPSLESKASIGAPGERTRADLIRDRVAITSIQSNPRPVGIKLPYRKADTRGISRGFALGDQRRVTRYLVYRCGSGPEQVVIWDTIDITVGRRKNQDIAVDDAEVSREHAVFRKVGDVYTVEDLGTGLGTLVNGERIKSHDLQGGDVVQVGSLAIKFGQTHRPIRAGGRVRYASELKGFGPQPGAKGAGGRTMLAFDAAEDLAPPTLASEQESGGAKVFTSEGILEDLAGDDPLGSEDHDDYLGPPPQVRDLDRELAEDPGMGPTQTIVRLEVELEGPRADLQAVICAIVDKPIEVPPVKIRIRQLGHD